MAELAELAPVHFTSLSVAQFRNHTAGIYALGDNVHAFAGANGIGKTNLLEALHYLCMARGFRTHRTADREAIQHGETWWMVEGVLGDNREKEDNQDNELLVSDNQLDTSISAFSLSSSLSPRKLQCTYLEGKGKRLLVDGKPLARLSDHVGRIPVVTLLPEDNDLIREAAALRRRWLDTLLAQGSQGYLQALTRYDHALDQRNALLARWAEPGGPAFDPEELALWDEPLAVAGSFIRQARAAFVAAFAPVLVRTYRQVAERDAEVPALTYETAVPEGDAAGYRTGLQQAQLADRGAGRSTWGIHRDDLNLLLNGTPIRGHGSQGQQKTFVIALKLAQHAYLHQATGRAPLLLFDDVFDRLDPQRAARIFQLLCTELPGQKVLTDTTPERLAAMLRPFQLDSYVSVVA